MVQGAVYDAVNALDPGYEPYLLDVDVLHAQPFGSADAAIATAAHHVLVEIVAAAQVAGLDAAYTATMAEIPDGPVEDEGVRVGAAAAAAMLAARADDGFMAPFTFTIGVEAGDWRPVGFSVDPPAAGARDLDAWVGNLEPFLIESRRSSVPRPEPVDQRSLLGGLHEVNEVGERGEEVGAPNSATRTADQTTAAIFWQFAPTALWNRLARDLSAAHDVAVADDARLLAMINSLRPTVPSAAGTTSTTGASGGRARRFGRPRATGTPPPWPTRPRSRCSTRRRRQAGVSEGATN